MKLKTLHIEVQRSYEDHPGKYRAEIEFEGASGSVKMNLDAAITESLLSFIGPVLTKFSHQAALEVEKNILASVEEAGKAPMIEA